MDISPELRAKLNTLALVGRDLKPLFKRLMVVIAAETKKRFATSTDVDGKPFKPLVFRNGRPLWDRGLMMKSVTSLQAPEGIREITNMGLVFGTKTEYADTHNEGKTIKARPGSLLRFPVPTYSSKVSKKTGKTSTKKTGERFIFAKQVTVPKRQFLGWNQNMVEACETVIRDWILEQL